MNVSEAVEICRMTASCGRRVVALSLASFFVATLLSTAVSADGDPPILNDLFLSFTGEYHVTPHSRDGAATCRAMPQPARSPRST